MPHGCFAFLLFWIFPNRTWTEFPSQWNYTLLRTKVEATWVQYIITAAHWRDKKGWNSQNTTLKLSIILETSWVDLQVLKCFKEANGNLHLAHQHNMQTIVYFYRRNLLKAVLFKSMNLPCLYHFCRSGVKMRLSSTWFSYRSLFNLPVLGLSLVQCHPVQEALRFQTQGDGKLSREQDSNPAFLKQFPSCFAPAIWPTQTDIQLLVEQKVNTWGRRHSKLKLRLWVEKIFGFLWHFHVYIFIYLVHIYILKTFDFKRKPLIRWLFLRGLRGFL